MPPLTIAARAVVACLPVLLFLTTLVLLDTFRLVRRRRVAVALVAGGVTALATYFLNTWLLDLTDLPSWRFAVLVAPLVEETAKGAYVAWLIATRRAGFLVDTAILGFAVGAGFAIVENVYYLSQLPDAPLLVWAVRGLGTAIMHGGVTALLGLMVQAFGERRGAGSGRPWLGALLVAALLHAMFNRFMVQPLIATALTLAILPVAMTAAWRFGERRLRRWLGRGFDLDSELLGLIRDGQVSGTPVGLYLQSLRDGFRADTVADMLCLLRLQCELSLRAKGTLLLREQGFEPAHDPELAARLAELRWLEKSVGRAGLLALRPLARWRGTDAWQRHLLEEQASPAPARAR
jgi:RsiW-degrading membrane proteinase PrsW (M82 family)